MIIACILDTKLQLIVNSYLNTYSLPAFLDFGKALKTFISYNSDQCHFFAYQLIPILHRRKARTGGKSKR